MSIVQRRPAVRMRRERTRSQRYRQVCAELEHMHRMHPLEGCHEAYPKLRKANEKLIKHIETISGFFAEQASLDSRHAAALRIQGKADLAELCMRRSQSLDVFAEVGFQLLIETVHLGSQSPE